MAKEFTIEYITRDWAGDFFNGGYAGQWADETVEADDREQAIEILKQHFIEEGEDPEEVEKNYLFR